jgi:two-component system nitrogen regulation response regulator NtrX
MNKATSHRILIIDDEAPIREVLAASLKDENYTVETAADGALGLQKIKEFQPEVVFLDIWMPGEIDGMDVLAVAVKSYPHIDFIMISGHGTIETAVKATKLGAWDFIEKPLSMDKIYITVQNVLQLQAQKQEKLTLLHRLRKNIALMGDSVPMMELKQLIAKVAPLDEPVVLQGEDGSGKNMVAQNIHYTSPRAGRPWVEINCKSVAPELIELEIFGYEAGSIAGAQTAHKGKLELADGGTLYLDEVTELPGPVQEKLLHFLKTKSFARFGGRQKISSDVRIIVSTQRHLFQEVQQGRFRQDLLDLLCVQFFPIPPLRHHPEDIASLVRYFSDSMAHQTGLALKSFSEEAMDLMLKYAWPGNVRELKNFIERVYILTPGDFVDAHDLRFAGLPPSTSSSTSETNEEGTFREARARFEKDYLLKKIAENQGNISRTAESIGLERSYLHRKMKSYGIETSKTSEEA